MERDRVLDEEWEAINLVEEIPLEVTDEVRQMVLWEDFDDGSDIWEHREWRDLDT